LSVQSSQEQFFFLFFFVANLRILLFTSDDPEFGNQKASYHADLSDPTRFKEVVPIRDEQIKSKIHLTYRLQYFKDIILARIMDDSTFSIINSMLFFNQVEIVQYLHSSDHFMRDLFGIFDMGTDPPPASSSSPIIGPPLPPSMVSERSNSKLDGPALLERKIDTIMFLQQLCSMAKHLQAPSRISFFRSLAERGILKVIEFGLSKENLTNHNTDPSAVELGSTEPPKTEEVREEGAMIKSVVCEILMTIIDYDPSSVRGYCLKQRQEGTKTLAESLIELLISEADLGLKVQLTDALRTLLDMGGTGLGNPSTNMALADSNGLLKRDEDPDNERFLQFFYDHCVHVLARPFLQLPELIPYAPGKSITPLQRKSLLAEINLEWTSLVDDQEPVSITPLEAATFNHLCEMICFIIVQHSFRSKYFILSTNLLNKIGSLLRIIGPRTSIPPSPTSKTTPQGGKPRTAEDEKDPSVDPPHPQQIQVKKKSSYKYLELVGLKILKTCFNKKDQFYDRALIKNSLIDHVVLDLFVFQDGKDNLVSSACLELFENIRLVRPLVLSFVLLHKLNNTHFFWGVCRIIRNRSSII
jgi:protein phosphatase-4 regulatory subunit 3